MNCALSFCITKDCTIQPKIDYTTQWRTLLGNVTSVRITRMQPVPQWRTNNTNQYHPQCPFLTSRSVGNPNHEGVSWFARKVVSLWSFRPCTTTFCSVGLFLALVICAFRCSLNAVEVCNGDSSRVKRRAGARIFPCCSVHKSLVWLQRLSWSCNMLSTCFVVVFCRIAIQQIRVE